MKREKDYESLCISSLKRPGLLQRRKILWCQNPGLGLRTPRNQSALTSISDGRSCDLILECDGDAWYLLVPKLWDRTVSATGGGTRKYFSNIFD